MNKKVYSIIVVIYTVFNIGALIGFNFYENKNNDENYIGNKDSYVQNQQKTAENEEEVNVQENENEDKIEGKVEEKIKKTEKSSNNAADKNNIMYESDKEIYNNSSYKSSNSYKGKESSSESNKVFKLSAEEIISDLSPVEKAKVLFVCRKLTKAEYNEIEEYLSYNNEKLGVTKVFNILENRLDEESLEEVIEIFSKYMDVDKVDEIN